ncbi:MAG TPA: class F sortase [Candidatus Paceibacterota bacterium]
MLPASRYRFAYRREAWANVLRSVAIAAGIFVVLVGLADITSRMAQSVLGEDALFDAFAPAAALRPVAVPLPAAQASSSAALVPTRLKVPSLGIDAQVEEIGHKADGSMGTPKDFMHAGWWSEGSRPGEAGSAVFDGHVNNALTRAGVFEHLSQISKGDYITVSDAAGKTLVYTVSEVALYDTDASTASLFSKTGPSRLVLITCEGEWLEDERSYDKRLVVVAKPAY